MTDGEALGPKGGCWLGMVLGLPLGPSLGRPVGSEEGMSYATTIGPELGVREVELIGGSVGTDVLGIGSSVNVGDADAEGALDGLVLSDGDPEGLIDGTLESKSNRSTTLPSLSKTSPSLIFVKFSISMSVMASLSASTKSGNAIFATCTLSDTSTGGWLAGSRVACKSLPLVISLLPNSGCRSLQSRH